MQEQRQLLVRRTGRLTYRHRLTLRPHSTNSRLGEAASAQRLHQHVKGWIESHERALASLRCAGALWMSRRSATNLLAHGKRGGDSLIGGPNKVTDSEKFEAQGRAYSGLKEANPTSQRFVPQWRLIARGCTIPSARSHASSRIPQQSVGRADHGGIHKKHL